ncbi:flagellar basal body rod protein FlgB [Myxococcota bacterium]|nr:flagellar basal body rod protein FlgB [Myxococcota bacterium]MBU1379831.1 flagellar basal body rod protein FlgB [Myxococcota bacterium]MBU1496499.1 flagellar basal body rod protein FlgB [Myxococcota bacterium]
MAGMFNAITPHRQTLNYHLDRHNLLASNIANVDTPGFVSKDIKLDNEKDEDFGKLISNHSLDIKDSSFDGEGEENQIFDDPSTKPGNDKNAVDLDREMAKVAANSLKYEAIATIVTKHLGMLRYGANDGR